MDSNEKNLENMTQEDIERLLAEQEQQSAEEQYNFEDADLASLLSQLEAADDGDIQEISDLLDKADKNEAVAEDVVALMKEQEAAGETAYDAMDLFSDGEQEKKEGFFKRLLKKFKTKKQENQEKNQDKQEKKLEKQKKKQDKQEKKRNKQEKKQDTPNTQEVQEENLPQESSDELMDFAIAMLNSEAEGDSTQQENSAVVEEKEKKTAKKKKEKKPKKSKKASKAKEGDAVDEEDEATAEKSGKKKKAKKVKEKKAKGKKPQDNVIREKPVVEETVNIIEEEETEEFPHKKKIIMVFVAAIMIMLGFLVVNHYYTGHTNKQLAEEAYEAEDYLECYQLLYGQKLNDSQTAMFHRSELTLMMNMFWNHYNEFVAEQKQLEGLDKLVQFVYDYPEVYAYAAEWNCLDTVEPTYNEVLNILSVEYEVDEQRVLEIAGFEDDVDYTKELTALVEKKQKNDELEQKYPDILPEEKDKAEQE